MASLQSTDLNKLSLESRERVKALLARRQEWSGERLRMWRVIQILEGIGNPDAKFLLKRLADGASGSRLTQEAKASLERLKN